MNTRHPGRPKSTEPKACCRAQNCGREANGSKGFCHTHYIYSRRGVISAETGLRVREPQRIARYAPDAVCLIPDCGERPRSRGMCNKHMLQRDAGIISADGTQLRALLPTGRKRERERWVSSTRDGYVLRVAPDGHPHARQDGSILEHRLVMEQALGRYLEEWEVVHHKDGNRQNNVWENLELLDGRAKNGSESHSPAHEFDQATAIQALLQRDDLPMGLRLPLLQQRTRLKQQAG